MKRGEKVGLGLLVVLFASCLVGAALLLFTDSGLAFLKGTSAVGRQASALSRLDERYPFTPPAGGLIPEDRLLAYLDVCCEVRAKAAPLESWRESHDGLRVLGQPVFQGEGGDLAAGFLKAMAEALDRRRMGPDEWQWIANAMELAEAGPSSAEAAVHARRTEDGGKGDAGRGAPSKHRAGDLVRFDTFEAPTATAMDANAALYARYAERLKACAVGRRCRTILAEILPCLPGRPRGQVVVVNP